MKKNRLIGLLLLVIGGFLLYFGFNAANSPVEELSEMVSGRYSDETMYYLVGGAIAVLLGLVLVLKK